MQHPDKRLAPTRTSDVVITVCDVFIAIVGHVRNDHHQRCEPPAEGLGMLTELDGRLASAAGCGSISWCDSGEENATQVMRHSAAVEIAPSIQIGLERPMVICRHTIFYRAGSATPGKPEPLRTFPEREGTSIVRSCVGRFVHSPNLARDPGAHDRLKSLRVHNLPRSGRRHQAAVTEWHAACDRQQ